MGNTLVVRGDADNLVNYPIESAIGSLDESGYQALIVGLAQNPQDSAQFVWVIDSLFQREKNTSIGHITSIIAELYQLGDRANLSPEEHLHLRLSLVHFCKKAKHHFPNNAEIDLYLSLAYGTLCAAYDTLEDDEKVLETGLKWVAFTQAAKDRYHEAENITFLLAVGYNILSYAYIERHNYDVAFDNAVSTLTYCTNSLAQFPENEDIKNQFEMANIMLADLYLFKSNPVEAERLAKKSLINTQGIGYGNTTLIQAFLMQRKVELAKAHFQKVKNQALDEEDDETLLEALYRQLNEKEAAGVFSSDNPDVAEFRSFLKEQE